MTRGEIYRIRLPGSWPRASRSSLCGHRSSQRAARAIDRDRRPDVPPGRPASFRPDIELAGETTRVLVEQLRAVDLERLDELTGRLSGQEQRAVDDALALVLDLR